MYENTVRHNGTQDYDNAPKLRARPPWLPPREIPNSYYYNLFGTEFKEGDLPSEEKGIKRSSSQWTVGFAKEPQASRVPSVFDYMNYSGSNISMASVNSSATPNNSSAKSINSPAKAANDYLNRLNDLQKVDMSIYMGFPPRGLSKLASMNVNPNMPSVIKSIRRSSLQYAPYRVPFNPTNTRPAYPRIGGIMEMGVPFTEGYEQPAYMPNMIPKSRKSRDGPWNIMDRYLNNNNNNNNNNGNLMDPGGLSRIIETEMPRQR